MPAAGKISIRRKGSALWPFLLMAIGLALSPLELHAQRIEPGLRLPKDTATAFERPLSLSPLFLSGGGPSSRPPSLSGLLGRPDIPRAYSYQELGFFCKWEVQLEKAAQLPVKFRLGEVQYVERMEGKLPDISRPDYR